MSFGNQTHSRWAPVVSLILAAMLWSTSFAIVKAAMVNYHPYMLIFGRMLVATICSLPIFYRQHWTLAIKPGTLKLILFMAFCEPCLYYLMEVEALKYTTASQAGMITAMLPLLVALGAFLFLKEKISTPMLIGLVLAIGGACWLSVAGQPSAWAPKPILGNFLEFLAMVCATGYMLCARRLVLDYGYSALMITALQAVIGFFFYLPLLLLPGVHFNAHLEKDFLWVILYLGGVITMGAYGFYNFGMSRMPAGQAALFINMIPIFAVFFGWLILDEKFTLSQYIAGGVILAGIYLSQKKT